MKIRKPLLEPGLPDLMASLKYSVMESLNCAMPGVIQSFNATTKTAEVQLMIKQVYNDKIASYPLLVDVPVFTLQGGGGAVYMPVQKGDPCLVLFADRNIDTWYSNGAEAAPANQRLHDIGDGIAFVGICNKSSSLADYPASEAGVRYSGARLGLKGGKANIQNASKSLLGALTELIQGIQLAQTTTPGAPIADSSGKIASALLSLQALLYND